MKKHSQSRRRFVRDLTTLSVTAATMTPLQAWALIPVGEQDAKYHHFIKPSREGVEKIARNPNHPNFLNLTYSIPGNDAGLTGGLVLTRNGDSSKIVINFNHAEESKLITFTREGDTYQEKEHDRKNNEIYNPQFYETGNLTLLRVVEGLFEGRTPERVKFEYHGREDSRRIVSLESKRVPSEEGIIVAGEVSGKGTLVESFQIGCMEFGKHLFPTELLLNYKLKNVGPLGLFSGTMPFRAVLQI